MVKLVIQINTSTDGIDKTCLVDLYANISISGIVLNVSTQWLGNQLRCLATKQRFE